MIAFDKDGCIDLNRCEFKELRDYYAGQILAKFIEEGDKGFRSELFEAMYTATEWFKLKEARIKGK